MQEVFNPLIKDNYKMLTLVYFGRGELEKLGEITDFKKILIVAGKHFIESANYTRLLTLLKGKNIIVYDREIHKSTPFEINNLLAFIKNNKSDCVIGIGGGTILDTTKAASVLINNSEKVENYIFNDGKKIENKGVFFIAVPTTAGTGSEVTPFVVVWDVLSKKKYSLTSDLLFPDIAIVDPSLTDELPKKLTAETGMDALTQAIEAYWAKSNNPTSDNYSLQSIKIILEFLPTAVNNSNSNSRDMMSKGALLSGLAFSNTRTTICHSISYPITAHFGVAHGQAVSITLPLMINYSFQSLDENRRNNLLSAIGEKTISEAADKVTNVMKEIGLAVKLSELGLKKEDVDLIVSEGFNPDRMNNAPRVPTKEELKTLLLSIL